MKIFKGKYRKVEEGDGFKKFSKKSFRKTGKNLLLYDFQTIFVPKYNRFKCWFD